MAAGAHRARLGPRHVAAGRPDRTDAPLAFTEVLSGHEPLWFTTAHEWATRYPRPSASHRTTPRPSATCRSSPVGARSGSSRSPCCPNDGCPTRTRRRPSPSPSSPRRRWTGPRCWRPRPRPAGSPSASARSRPAGQGHRPGVGRRGRRRARPDLDRGRGGRGARRRRGRHALAAARVRLAGRRPADAHPGRAHPLSRAVSSGEPIWNAGEAAEGRSGATRCRPRCR